MGPQGHPSLSGSIVSLIALPSRFVVMVKSSGPIVQNLLVASIAGRVPGMGENAPPVCVPVTVILASKEEPSSVFLGTSFVGLNYKEIGT